jgi:hypothetical protein
MAMATRGMPTVRHAVLSIARADMTRFVRLGAAGSVEGGEVIAVVGAVALFSRAASERSVSKPPGD